MRRADIGAWLETYRARVLPHVKEVAGFRSVTFHAAREGDPCRVTVVTRWDDMGAVRRFAGDDPARTVLPDFMAPFFPDDGAEASFHDEVLLEEMA